MRQDRQFVGRKFGKLTVLRKSQKTKPRRTYYECRCDCGRVIDVRSDHLTSGKITACGCDSITGFKDLSGMRFGRLIVKERVGTKSRSPLWRCTCDCGKDTYATSRSLKSGRTQSCGCLQADNRRGLKGKTKHGQYGTRLYGVWTDMKSRCLNPNAKNYKHYGGRGISICDEWLNDFAAFSEWAFANGYDPNAPYGACTIDRIDVNGNYEPSNCRWADAKTQARNRRKGSLNMPTLFDIEGITA